MQKIVENDDLQSLINHTKCHSSIIEKSLISFGKEIGTGEFGGIDLNWIRNKIVLIDYFNRLAVYKGKYKDTDIAIKVIKDQTTIKEFFKEAAVMS